jgi:hypothetical protein
MIAEYEAYIKQHSNGQFTSLPGYFPNTTIPPEFPDPEASNPDASTHRLTNSPNYTMPSWLTLEGGTTVAPYPQGAGYTKIGDFKTLDELGRALCTSPGAGQISAHASAHVLIGGDMNTFQSPKDEIFPAWHKLIDYYRQLWASTPNGQAFFKANPDKLKPLPMGGMKMGGPLNSEYLANQPLFNPDGSPRGPLTASSSQ